MLRTRIMELDNGEHVTQIWKTNKKGEVVLETVPTERSQIRPPREPVLLRPSVKGIDVPRGGKQTNVILGIYKDLEEETI